MATTIDIENAKQIRQSMDVIITITPPGGTQITITDDDLVSCVVSLRSDLSILEPTLPESEINIEAYMNTDISATLAAIPDGTPVTYQAGYDSDLSTVRNFYLAEQITWADNVMTIHAVDAVHLLDEEIPTNILVANTENRAANLTDLIMFTQSLIVDAGITCNGIAVRSPDVQDSTSYLQVYTDIPHLVFYQKSRRDILAGLMNLVRMDFASGYLSDGTAIYINYVDAGIPTFSITKPTSKWSINESDCGDVQRETERKLTSITLTYSKANRSTTLGSFSNRTEVGSGTWIYNGGVAFDFTNEFIYTFGAGYMEGSSPATLQTLYAGRTISTSRPGVVRTFLDLTTRQFACYLMQNNVKTGLFKHAINNNEDLYTQFMPWTTQQSTAWSNNSLTTSSTYTVELRGSVYSEESFETVLGATGYNANVENDLFFGRLYTYGDSTGNTQTEILPIAGYTNLLNRSNVKGSFTWKGDPRMQPRDVVTFTRLDGTTEDITLENITITHENGGTSAEITYRKGIC